MNNHVITSSEFTQAIYERMIDDDTSNYEIFQNIKTFLIQDNLST